MSIEELIKEIHTHFPSLDVQLTIFAPNGGRVSKTYRVNAGTMKASFQLFGSWEAILKQWQDTKSTFTVE